MKILRPFLLTAPSLFVVFAIVGIPLVYSLVLSLHRINMLTQQWMFVGLDNYLRILPGPEFLGALGRTVYFSTITVGGGLVLGMAMALVLNAQFWGRGLLRSLVLVPWAMSPVAVGVLWAWIYDGTYGTLNAALLDFGIVEKTIPWLGDGDRAMNLVAVAYIWNQAPLASLLILAGLQSIPENLHRAARIDGAGPIMRFFKITLPWLRPMLLLIMILTTINSIMAFDLFWTLTKGGPGSATTVFSWLGYAYAFHFFKFGEGAAILYCLTILCLLLAYIYLKIFFPTVKLQGGKTAAQTAAESADINGSLAQSLIAATDRQRVATSSLLKRLSISTLQHRHSWLGVWMRRIMAYSSLRLAALLIAFWSIAPFVWLLIMSLSNPVDLVRVPPTLLPTELTWQNYQYVLFGEGVGEGHAGQSSVQARRVPISIWNSFVIAAIVTAINLVLGSFAGYAYARHGRSRLMNGTLWALMMTRMTPGLALILPFFIVFRTLDLIDTRWALIISYSSFILPLSIWMMKGYFESMPPNLEKAALVDGCTWFQAIYKIILPVARPGIVAAGIFCFLVSWNEFIFALILTATPKAQTIPVILAGFMAQVRFYDFGPLFAASILAVLPPVLVAFLFQRYLVQGMLSGSLKG
jgi:ABC-type glycerol-3-phosphate transport system permease component